MRNDDGGGIVQQCLPGNFARMNRRFRQRPEKQVFRFDQLVLVGQEQHREHFAGLLFQAQAQKVAHFVRCIQRHCMLAQITVENVQCLPDDLLLSCAQFTKSINGASSVYRRFLCEQCSLQKGLKPFGVKTR